MELNIGGHIFKLYNQVSINLKYDSPADTFAMKLYFNPDDQVHRKIFRPLTYHTCTITHGGVKVMTATMLSHRFRSAGDPPKQLVDVSGYTLSGVLCDCTVGIFQDLYSKDVKGSPEPNQFDGLTLEQIATTICKVFPLKVHVDAELKADAQFMTPYVHCIIKQDQMIADFLDDLCKQKNAVLSHDASGNLVITRAKANALLTTSATTVMANVNPVPVSSDIAGAPQSVATQTTTTTKIQPRAILYDFKDADDPAILYGFNGTRDTGMDLSVDGQKMHSVIQVIGEQNGENALDSSIINPFVDDQSSGKFKAGLRYRRVIQTAGYNNDTPDTARSVLGDELKNIVLTIDINGWTLNGNLVTPNQMVTVKNKDLGIFYKTKFFIQEVALNGDEKKETATLTCVLPVCFNNDKVVNIF